jgi:hypothetical protein
MLETIESEVGGQTEIYAPYLATCAERFAQHNPIAMLIPAELTMDFAGVALRLGYLLAKKPWELEAQLNELKATYGTISYKEDDNGS